MATTSVWDCLDCISILNAIVSELFANNKQQFLFLGDSSPVIRSLSIHNHICPPWPKSLIGVRMEGLACHQPVSGSSRKYDKKLINYLLVSRQIPPELQIRIIRHLKPWIEVTKTKINFGLPKEFKTMALMVTGYTLTSKLWAKEVRILYYRFCHILEHRHTRSFFSRYAICT